MKNGGEKYYGGKEEVRRFLKIIQGKLNEVKRTKTEAGLRKLGTRSRVASAPALNPVSQWVPEKNSLAGRKKQKIMFSCFFVLLDLFTVILAISHIAW